MIMLCVSSLLVTALHLWHLPDTHHDHVGRHLQWGRYQQPSWVHWGAHGPWGGARRDARGSRETWTYGGPPVGEQWVHHHQEEEEPARSQHHPEYACHWQILPDDLPWFIHLLQPYLLVRLLLRDTSKPGQRLTESGTVTIWMLHQYGISLDKS